MENFISVLEKSYSKIADTYFCDKNLTEGYWSNLEKNEQVLLLSQLDRKTSMEVVNNLFPQLEEIIFDPMRAVGLRLLDIKPNEHGVDYGCMWGNLLIYAANNCEAMLGIDQTKESLAFVNHRLKEERIGNCYLLNANLRDDLPFSEMFDFAIINGVLEWVAEDNQVELEKFLSRSRFKLISPRENPRNIQLRFLEMVRNNLKTNGRMYLAIENRYDYQHFLWKRDPHPNIYYTAFLPRKVSNLICNFWFGRPYVNYLYSFGELENLVKEAGFDEVEKYAVFPDYRFPIKIIPLDKYDNNDYEPVYNLVQTSDIKKKIFHRIRREIDNIIYKKLKLLYFAPSIIIIARKG